MYHKINTNRFYPINLEFQLGKNTEVIGGREIVKINIPLLGVKKDFGSDAFSCHRHSKLQQF